MVGAGAEGGSSPRPLRVMIVENNWVWASAMERQVDGAAGIEWVGTATSGEEGLALAVERRPDVALVDLLLGEDSGLRLARTLGHRAPEVRVVMVSIEPSAWALAEARAAGAGFVSKDDLLTREGILAVLRRVAAGERVYSERVRALEAPSDAAGAPGGAGRLGLTPREMELVGCLVRGLGTPEIMRQMSLSPSRVRNLTVEVGKKLGVSGRLAIVVRAHDEGLVDPPGRR